MTFQQFLSILSSAKTPIPTREGAPLRVAPEREKPYIEPRFKKEVFEVEKPSVVLLAAVGATGKSAAAQVFSNQMRAPLLDLSVHKAVGDSTISGLLGTSFSPENLGSAFAGLASGKLALIIDGLDEGRAKASSQSFDAFLDDVARLCKGSSAPSFIMLGRTAIVDDCWLALTDKGVSVGVVSIEPFDRKQAVEYIDKVVGGVGVGQRAKYELARDSILGCLSNAFSDAETSEDRFLSFVGYPPVLDAVATLLSDERNYHKVHTEVTAGSGGDREVELLRRICQRILEREQEDKIWVNILAELAASLTTAQKETIRKTGFSIREQAFRLVSFCLQTPALVPVFADAVLDAKYEEQLGGFFHEHPFLSGKTFRNAVFEAFALATLITKGEEEDRFLALSYLEKNRASYHLLYMLSELNNSATFPSDSIRVLVASALDFRSKRTAVDLTIDSDEARDATASSLLSVAISIGTQNRDGAVDDASSLTREFVFASTCDAGAVLDLGGFVADAYIELDARVCLSHCNAIELVAPVEIIASEIILKSPGLAVSRSSKTGDQQVVLVCEELRTDVMELVNTGSLRIQTSSAQKFSYPLVSYIQREAKDLKDPLLKEKYLRLRKILTHFRSHSKGSLAKYADKVENERVAGNATGAAILKRLLENEILVKEGNFYHLRPAAINSFLGVSWTDLRAGIVQEKLVTYLAEIAI